jgi:curved DNA-binding protein CbpA
VTSRDDLDPYVVLRLQRQATAEEIARAYRRAARATHPDGGDQGAGSEQFRAVREAYDVLRDPGRRADYDRLHPIQRQQRARATRSSLRYAATGSRQAVHGSRGASPARGVVVSVMVELRVALSLLRDR